MAAPPTDICCCNCRYWAQNYHPNPADKAEDVYGWCTWREETGAWFRPKIEGETRVVLKVGIETHAAARCKCFTAVAR
jgi:hypothetical protein